MLGTLLFVVFFVKLFVLAMFMRGRSLMSTLAMGIYILGVVACFGFSAVFHIFSDHSPQVHKFSHELDHLGIVFVLWGTGISSTHLAFYCQPSLAHGYFLLLTLAGSGCATFSLRPQFRQNSYRIVRFLSHTLLGASLFAPLIHSWAYVGWEVLNEMTDLESFLWLTLINFSGSLLYALRVPERWFPGRFDLFGNGHNWMHLFVIAGALVRLDGMLRVMQRWQDRSDVAGYCVGLYA